MSIPPLVCSTPPPPDQCEDDKDPEDFDLQYNLSQEEDYDYESFSTYSHFQSAVSESKQTESPINVIANKNVNNSHGTEINKDSEMLHWPNAKTDVEFKQNDQEPAINTKLNNEEEFSIKNNIIKEDDLNVESKLESDNTIPIEEKLNNEEEPNVEDLNLTVEEEESISSNLKSELDSDTDSNKFDSSDKDKALHIPNMTTSSVDVDNNETASNVDDITIGTSSTGNIEELPNLTEDQKVDHIDGSDNADIKNEHEPEPKVDMSDSMATHIVDSSSCKSIEKENEVNNETDDEFGDFNDFHVTSVNKLSTVVDVCDNPWDNSPPKSDFGAFEAHFDEAENIKPPLFESVEEKSILNIKNEHDNIADDDDDFGDFDDFKSSTQGTKDEEVIQDSLSRVPVLDFQSSDNEGQVLENINKILNGVFEEDIPEAESAFECKLESLLCETWGHLLETDVRQPYIVNWNSSFGQKTLLKALCIDSRNILFGPKWHYNMPKYAANLSTAPLQPQKQSTPSGALPSEASSDKNTTKTSTAWADPFTSDGQEFTYAEALLLDLEHLMATLDQMAHNHSNLKISELLSHACNKENTAEAQKRPTDLGFNPVLSSTSGQIFSSTLDVQPIRQINLPDTHIFTPTDSETPRSKTIHYDIPPVYLSQSSTENDKKTTEIAPSEFSSNVDGKSLDDGDYSDFQDFKGSFDINATIEKRASVPSLDSVKPPENPQQPLSTGVTYSIGILQPIKIEPTMPTLNWPSPGEVKETFDDFSEFASNTTWNNASQEIQTPSIDVEKDQISTITPVRLESINTTKNEGPNNEVTISKNDDSFDDEFDTFQSALPVKVPNPMVPINNLGNFETTNFTQNVSSQSFPNQGADFDFAFPKNDVVKSDAISLTRPIDIHKHSELIMHQTTLVENTPTVKESIAKIPGPRISRTQPPAANVLQPIVNPPSAQSNTAQILQPLSLESFSQINWPNPGINLQDLSSFNPVETLNSLKSDLSVSGNSKGASPVHSQKTSAQSQPPEDDIWGEFVSSKPKPQPVPKNAASFIDDDEWTDFVSSPTVKPQNGLNTISLNVHTNSNMQKPSKQNKLTNQALEIPTLNIITPKSSNHSSYNDRHFQNL